MRVQGTQGNKLLHLQRNWMWSTNLRNRCVCTRNPVIVIFHIIQSIFPNIKHANVCLIKIQVANAFLLFICHHVVVLKWTWWKRRFGHMCTFLYHAHVICKATWMFQHNHAIHPNFTDAIIPCKTVTIPVCLENVRLQLIIRVLSLCTCNNMPNS